MSLQRNIKDGLNKLKRTATTVYSSDGTVYKETRDEEGSFCIAKLNACTSGFIIDNTPDLSVSRILPWLCMGSQDVAQDHNLLRTNKITHILGIGIPCPKYEDIQTTFIEAYDIDEFRIIDIFNKCCHIIDQVQREGGTVYVHCNAGVSRSATIVAAYLIYYKRINHTQALDIIKRQRPKINPNQGFRRQLHEYANNVNRETAQQR